MAKTKKIQTKPKKSGFSFVVPSQYHPVWMGLVLRPIIGCEFPSHEDLYEAVSFRVMEMEHVLPDDVIVRAFVSWAFRHGWFLYLSRGPAEYRVVPPMSREEFIYD
jgi:hypothetical protein